jgi:hypothetical protein
VVNDRAAVRKLLRVQQHQAQIIDHIA